MRDGRPGWFRWEGVTSSRPSRGQLYRVAQQRLNGTSRSSRSILGHGGSRVQSRGWSVTNSIPGREPRSPRLLLPPNLARVRWRGGSATRVMSDSLEQLLQATRPRVSSCRCGPSRGSLRTTRGRRRSCAAANHPTFPTYAQRWSGSLDSFRFTASVDDAPSGGPGAGNQCGSPDRNR
jgi:hypothetical protein